MLFFYYLLRDIAVGRKITHASNNIKMNDIRIVILRKTFCSLYFRRKRCAEKRATFVVFLLNHALRQKEFVEISPQRLPSVPQRLASVRHIPHARLAATRCPNICIYFLSWYGDGHKKESPTRRVPISVIACTARAPRVACTDDTSFDRPCFCAAFGSLQPEDMGRGRPSSAGRAKV